MDSTTRPPVIITTTQNDRSHNNLLHSAGARNGSPVRDEYRHGDSQYYAVPASTRRSRSSARPYHDEDYSRRRERGDNLLSPHDVEAYRQSRPSVTYPSNSRHSAAPIDYGDDGYKYTNAGELVRYDLDHSQPSRSHRHDSFDREYYRPRASYVGSHKRSDGSKGDRGYAVPHGRSDGYSGPPPSTRGFDKINRDYTLDRDRQALPAAPKPPKPTPHTEASSSARDARDTRHSRPVSVSQEPLYRDSSYHTRDDLRDRRGHHRDRSDDRGTSEKRRPHSTQFYDESVPNRGFGIRTSPDAALDDRRDDRRDERRDDRRIRDDTHRNDQLHTGENLPPQSRKDRPLSFAGEGRYPESGRKDSSRDTSYGILETAGTGLGITAAAAGLVASRRDNAPPAKSSDEQRQDSHEASVAGLNRHEPESVEGYPPRGPVEASRDRHSPLSEHVRASVEDSSANPDSGGASLVKYSTPSASDSDDAGKGRVRRKHRPSNSFNPNDTGDLRQIKEQLAALRVHDREKQPIDSPAGELERQARSSSPSREASGMLEPARDDESYAVGFPAEKKHARVVSPPRDRRDDKPLRGILKQPSARFPEEANPIREGVAPHKEDKKLKEVPPGARWTKINRKVVNPEALTIGKERFEERDDFVIVLRVLSKEEIQAYAAATQVLRGTLYGILHARWLTVDAERRRTREDADHDPEHKHRHGDDSDHPHRHHRHHNTDDHGDDADGKLRDRDGDTADEVRRKGERDDGSDSSEERRLGSEKDNDRSRRSHRRDDSESDIDDRRRGRPQDDDGERDADRRRKARGDDGAEGDHRRGDGDRHHR